MKSQDKKHSKETKSGLKSHFYEKYLQEVRPGLMKTLGLTNIHQVPVIKAIVLNMGVGSAKENKKDLEFALADMEKIAGQKPLTTLARKSIAGFKIREGWPIGCKVTLRKKKMYDFLQRLVQIAAPRITDFRGFKTNSFDGRGNYSLGIKEQIIFTEIEYDKIDKIRGMDITIITSAQSDEEAFGLLKAFGFPFKTNEKEV